MHGVWREQRGALNALREVRRQGCHEPDVALGEVGAARLAQQRDGAPCPASAHEHGPELVAEAMRSLQLAMAHAPVELAARRLAQARGRPLRARERAELVVVGLTELDLVESWRGLARQPILDDLARRQQRGGVERQDADAVERHRASEDARRTQREIAHVKAAVTEAHDLILDQVGTGGTHRRAGARWALE